MLNRVFLYQKNNKSNEHILVVKNDNYLDIQSINLLENTVKKHHSGCNSATLRALTPNFLMAYKSIDLGLLRGFLLSAVVNALNQVPTV